MFRSTKNPIITIDDIKVSNPNLQVDGVFNSGSCIYNNEVILLLRVAESFKSTDNAKVTVITNSKEGIKLIELDKSNEELDFSDSRIIIDKKSKKTKYLTSLSHLRIARSKNGFDFEVDENPIKLEFSDHEMWGVEDPRITQIGDVFYINYTSVSKMGASTSMITTKDFKAFEKKGIIFLPENKDVCIFNEKINGLYYAYNRPVPKAFGEPDIWLSSSPDLINWGNHNYVLGVSDGDFWDNGRIGGGAPPIKTKSGWLSIYHAADKNNRYCLGAFLTPLDMPQKIIKKSNIPILIPEMDYELEGFFGNVVFTCGTVMLHNKLLIYYGAADDKMCVVEFTIDEIMDVMEDYVSQN